MPVTTTKLTLAQAKRQLKTQAKVVDNLDILVDNYTTKITKLSNSNEELTTELVAAYETLEDKDNIIKTLETQIKNVVERINNTNNELDDVYSDIKDYKEQIAFYKQIVNHVTKS